MDLVKPFIENILYPVMEKKNGNKIRNNISELKKSQVLSSRELKELQKEKLKQLLLSSIENVPVYEQYANLKEDIEADPFDALLKFPVLTKADFKSNPELYLNKTVSKNQLIPNCTGGSTSEPVKFYIDRYTVEYYEAARWRGLSWWDITPGSRCVMIWGNPIELNRNQQISFRIKERWLKNRIIIPAYSLKPELINRYLSKIKSYKPEYIYGYASSLYAFAELMDKRNVKLPVKIKIAVSTSETLHDFQRELIEKIFECPVVNEYGARDGGMIAYQCKSGNMHICCENAVLEVVDVKSYQPLPYGQSGLLLVTDLNNYSMPRLRYMIGDRGVLSEQCCDCGMGLPVLEKIDGREDDIFVTVDGTFIHGHAFNYISRELNAVKKFQIIQYSPSRAELSIIPNPDSPSNSVIKFIEGVRKLLPKTEINVKYVDDIPLTESGKFRYAIRKFSLR